MVWAESDSWKTAGLEGPCIPDSSAADQCHVTGSDQWNMSRNDKCPSESGPLLGSLDDRGAPRGAFTLTMAEPTQPETRGHGGAGPPTHNGSRDHGSRSTRKAVSTASCHHLVILLILLITQGQDFTFCTEKKEALNLDLPEIPTRIHQHLSFASAPASSPCSGALDLPHSLEGSSSCVTVP
ncbi:uncharacterized protein LOC123926390 [Meles meles]|uniref:uncharacterized protein LOC123926390 n=1 Tax=Meles meles TaxID=9662 RepID=UPI001E69C542|nr:uncharacterized protein LOC123926390 [Meles meles]